MTTLQTLADLLAPWQSAYSNSKTLSTGVTFAHLAGLLYGGGFAVAADRAALRAAAGADDIRRRVLGELEATHRPVLIALTVSFASGVALVTADIATFWASPVYWAKMGLIVLLLANGWVLRATERAAAVKSDAGDVVGEKALWGRLKLTAWVSLVAWGSIVLAGVTLMGVA
ncbi:MAG: hypothetical protein HYX65_03250 [Gemmatimonadetes bacterium]|nr:hypothetical protein [Gemmatimonadota bacterium]